MKSNCEESAKKQKTDQLNCQHCDYYCKKGTTLAKHMKTKHVVQQVSNAGPILDCSYCEKKFENMFEMQTHIADKHCERRVIEHGSSTPHTNSHDSSFVFSESMLDEFIDKDI